MDPSIEQEIKQGIQGAMKSAQNANEAMNGIDQMTLPKGVWRTLYAQNEAIASLCSALFLWSEEEFHA